MRLSILSSTFISKNMSSISKIAHMESSQKKIQQSCNSLTMKDNKKVS